MLFYLFNITALFKGSGTKYLRTAFVLDWRNESKHIYLALFRNIAQLLESPIVVLDVGARGRTLAQQWTGLADHVRFYGFELSSKEDCERMAQDDRRMGVNSTYIPIAISGRRERRQFHRKKKPTASSFYDNSFAERNFTKWRVVRSGTVINQRDRAKIIETSEVEAMTLDDLLVDKLVPCVDFVKIDAEGAELEIVQGAKVMLQGCLAAQLEVDFVERYNPENLFYHIDRILNEAGFSLFEFPRFLRAGRRASPVIVTEVNNYAADSSGQMLGADAVYLKDPFGPKYLDQHKFSNQTLLKVAIIAYVIGQLEFAMSILSALAQNDARVASLLERHTGR